MPIEHFPCRLCGQTTLGHDSYVVCQECVDDFAEDSADPMEPYRVGGGVEVRSELPPLSPDELESRLRRLLDDW
jgi:hypothetical protein